MIILLETRYQFNAIQFNFISDLSPYHTHHTLHKAVHNKNINNQQSQTVLSVTWCSVRPCNAYTLHDLF